MADQGKYPGRLIAVDGSRGKDVKAAADAIAGELRKAGVKCAVSRWDASGLFGELAASASGDQNISTRTLSLVYAADLAFRLRWEIRPILEAGGVVIAAPYVDTAVAFGASCGLGDDWLRDLLRFAPAVAVRGRTEERKIDRPWKGGGDRGYGEYGARSLKASSARAPSKRARQQMMQTLERMRGRGIFKLDAKGIAALVKAVTGTRPGAPRRSASRPRTGHK
jgi:hypothetical protein